MGRDRGPLGARVIGPEGLRAIRPTPTQGASAWLAARARLTPGREAIVDGTTRLSYEQLWSRVTRAAGLLRELGVGRDDRVAVLALNRVEFIELFYATAEIGAMLVPLNWRLAAPELDYQLQDAGAAALFVGPEHEGLARQLRQGPPLRVRIGLGDEYTHRRDAAAPRVSSEAERAAFGDPHLVLYTSGTTGHPKGAVLTHANVFWNAVNVTIGFGLSDRDTTVTVLPMFHSGGVGLFTVPTLTIGGRVVVLPKFDAAALLAAVEREGAHLVFGVPAIWLELARDPSFTAARYPTLRALPSGGAPLPVALIDTLAERGFAVIQGYGSPRPPPAARSSRGKTGGGRRAPSASRSRSSSSASPATISGRLGPARSAKSTSAARTCSRGTGAGRTRRRKRSPRTAGSAAATSATWTRRASSRSSTARRT